MRLHSWGITVIAAVAAVLVAALAIVLLRPGAPSSGRVGVPADSPSAGAVAAPLPATRIHRVSPVTAAGRLAPGYRVTDSGRGHCFSTSLVDDRLWRCFRGSNTILDPCWQARSAGTVLCLPEPWSREVTRVRLTAPLPAASKFGRRIWGLRLSVGPGLGCTVATGAVGSVGGRPVSYVCAHDWALLGNHPDRRQQTWRMATARLLGGHYRARGTLPLLAAWVATVP